MSLQRQQIRDLFKVSLNDYFMREEMKNVMGVLMDKKFRKWLIKGQSKQYAKLLNLQSVLDDSISSLDENDLQSKKSGKYVQQIDFQIDDIDSL